MKVFLTIVLLIPCFIFSQGYKTFQNANPYKMMFGLGWSIWDDDGNAGDLFKVESMQAEVFPSRLMFDYYFYKNIRFVYGCGSLKVQISWKKVKLRHICVFSIKKLMKSKKNLVFLGMMGSGKSSIGSLIAKKLQLNFIDIDNVIENELGLSIKKIFETKGENYFRKFEEKTTLKKPIRIKVI